MNTEIARVSKPKNWVEAIAEKASCDIKDVQRFIKKYQIVQTPLPGKPKRVNFQTIQFSGTKSGLHTNDFKFVFDGMGPGMWGLFSDGNLKGKTSVIEIVKWLLKGKVPTTLEAGVRNWIKSASLSFTIDSISHRIWIEQHERTLSGAIERANVKGEFDTIKEFNSEDEMEEVVSDFMLEQFELKEIASHRKNNDELETGSEVVHGWPALASAMFIGTDYSAIFGDVVVHGLPNRILNMYIGLPWIPTHSSLKALSENFREEAQVEQKKISVVEQNQKDRLAEISTELKKKIDEKGLLDVPSASGEQYNKLLQEYNDAFFQQQLSATEVTTLKAQLDQISQIAKEDEVKLRNFREDQAANKVFKRINPKCCPHCDRKITSDDLAREQTANTCSVCDHDMLAADSPDDLLAELQGAAGASKDAFDKQKKEVNEKQRVSNSWKQRATTLQGEINALKEQLENDKELIGKIATLDKEIYRLEILKSEFSKTDIKEADTVSTVIEHEIAPETSVDDAKILKVAIKETEARFQDMKKELLRDIEKKMLDYCAVVGLEHYSSIELSGTPTLKIEKDGIQTSYSKVSPGEKLRLKVIALLAIITIGEEKGYGRHPGFLFIDSPAAQEVNDEDLNALMLGLNQLCTVLPSLQVVVASRATAPLLDLIDDQHRKYAQEKQLLW